MSFHNRAIQSYGSVQASSSLAGAQGLQLTQMLFDGLVDALVALRGHLLHRSIAAKAAQVAKAHRIVMGLQSTLDFERGGEVARNLNDLYLYVAQPALAGRPYQGACGAPAQLIRRHLALARAPVRDVTAHPPFAQVTLPNLPVDAVLSAHRCGARDGTVGWCRLRIACRVGLLGGRRRSVPRPVHLRAGAEVVGLGARRALAPGP
jgi:flagellar protein FliS